MEADEVTGPGIRAFFSEGDQHVAEVVVQLSSPETAKQDG